MTHEAVIPAIPKVSPSKETTGGIRVERRGAMATLTLDRGGALNALNRAMISALTKSYLGFSRDPNLYIVVLRSADPKAFCAGGDVKALASLAKSDTEAARELLRAEYGLNWLHECFPKPTVAWIDGLVMGSGVGISAYATHRVAGPNYRFAMPETAIGFFPDVGVAHCFARLPSHLGRYLGLTGDAIGAADAYALGLVTHVLDKEEFAEVEQAIADAWPVDRYLDERHRDPGPAALAPHKETIAHCFAPPTVEEIMARLRGVRGESKAFAERTLAGLRQRSPLALKVTLRHIRQAEALDLRQTLEFDYRLACRFIASADFHEGVRAALIDKDHAPRWSPASLEDVTQQMLDDIFAPMPGVEINLSLQKEMQELRI